MELNLHTEFQPHPPQTSSATTPEGSAGAVDGFSSLRKLLWGISGVYLVTNKITGHKYVGATGNIFKRWRKHVSEAHKARLSARQVGLKRVPQTAEHKEKIAARYKAQAHIGGA